MAFASCAKSEPSDVPDNAFDEAEQYSWEETETIPQDDSDLVSDNMVSHQDVSEDDSIAYSVPASDDANVQPTAVDNDISDVDVMVCSITIRCTDALKFTDDLQIDLPPDGIIANGSVNFSDGDSVYDVLLKFGNENNVEITAKSSITGQYVQAIAQLREKACGASSGWMFAVNGTAPNCSSDRLEVNDLDYIEWYYVCSM